MVEELRDEEVKELEDSKIETCKDFPSNRRIVERLQA
jgi:hypothetical protein